LVTGADGFLGKNMVQKLLDEGKEVFAIVYAKNDISYNDNKLLHVTSMDLNDLMQHVELFKKAQIDTLYHFAWGGVKPELRNDTDVQMANINMAIKCMKFAKECEIKKVIFPGSTNEYLYYGKPIGKNAVPSPNNAYGAAKVASRYICSEYAKQYDIDFIYAIITGIYAPDRRDNNVIYYTIDKLVRGEKPSLTRLEQLWDYIYIDDVKEALYLLGEKGIGGKIYGVGHGDNWKLCNYIQIIHKLINEKLPLGIGEIPYNSDILPSSCIDLTEIKKDTGFEPKVSFEEGILQVINRIKGDLKEDYE